MTAPQDPGTESPGRGSSCRGRPPSWSRASCTLGLAITSFDGLVAEDYYKQGLAINRELARGAHAMALGIKGAAQFSPDGRRIRVVIGPDVEAPTLRITIVHPTLAGDDQSATLTRISAGVYEGDVRPPHHSNLRATVEDVPGKWKAGVQLAPR